MRVRLALVPVFLAMPIAVHAQSAGVVTVPVGTSVTLRADDALSFRVASTGTATLDAYGAAAAKRLGGVPCDTPTCAPIIRQRGDLGLPAAPVVSSGVVRASFLALPKVGHSLLVIENGYGRALVYRARITVKGRTTPTDVCLVLNRRRGYEHWPYAIDRIELSALRLVQHDPARPLPCA